MCTGGGGGVCACCAIDGPDPLRKTGARLHRARRDTRLERGGGRGLALCAFPQITCQVRQIDTYHKAMHRVVPEFVSLIKQCGAVPEFVT